MEWIEIEKQFPGEELILVSDGKGVFICEWIESKWGNHYRLMDWARNESDDSIEWMYWMPLPKPPGK